MKVTKFRRRRRLLLLPCLMLVFGSIPYSGWLLQTRPKEPLEAQGFTTEYRARGAIVYVRPSEYWALQLCLPFAFVLGFFAFRDDK